MELECCLTEAYWNSYQAIDAAEMAVIMADDLVSFEIPALHSTVRFRPMW